MKEVDNNEVVQKFIEFSELYTYGTDRGTVLTLHAEERINLFLGLSMLLLPKHKLLLPFLKISSVNSDSINVVEDDEFLINEHVAILTKRHGILWDLIIDVPGVVFLAFELKTSNYTKFGKHELQRHITVLDRLQSAYSHTQYITITPLNLQKHLSPQDKDLLSTIDFHSMSSKRWQDFEEIFRISGERYQDLRKNDDLSEIENANHLNGLNALAITVSLLNMMSSFDTV